MYLTVEASDLNRILSVVKGCVPNRTTIPLLQHILVIGSGSTLTVKATNMDREAEASCPAQLDENCLLVLPGEMFCGIIRRLPPGSQVSLNLKANSRVEVTSGSSKFVLRTLDNADEFPSLAANLDNGVSFMMNAQDLKHLLSKTAYASTKDVTTDPELYGVCLHKDGDKLVAVSSNRKQLGRWTMDLPMGAEVLPDDILIPLDGAEKMAAVLEGMSGDVRVSATNSMIGISTETMRFSTKLVGHKFLAYQKLLPKSTDAHIIVHPVALKDAVERAMMVYSGPTEVKQRLAQLDCADGKIVLSMGTLDADLAHEEIEADVKEAKCFIVDARFLSELLRQWPEDSDIDIQQAQMGKPIICSSRKHSGILHLLMPVPKKKMEVVERAA